ncbi:hypothetical protein LIER_06356 [Lithospermum erythrorhizon]|uniref:Uncharacterized protein n=1 Tax=Lithospermum erythrorhizon TaxID=34254 RepID=A0AAV3P589_LITER
MDQLKGTTPPLEGRAPAMSSFVREETYKHTPSVRTKNETLSGQQCHHEALVSGTAAPARATDAERNYACGHEAPILYQVHEEDGVGGIHRGISIRATRRDPRASEAEKRVEKGRGKHPMEDTRRRSPDPKLQSALDMIRAPDNGYSWADLPRGSPFSCLHGHPRKKMEIEDKQMLQRPPRQKYPQTKRDMIQTTGIIETTTNTSK